MSGVQSKIFFLRFFQSDRPLKAIPATLERGRSALFAYSFQKLGIDGLQGLAVSVLSRHAIVHECIHWICFDSITIAVHLSEPVLGLRIALTGSLFEPFERLCIILPKAVLCIIHFAKADLGGCISLIRGLPELLSCLQEVLLNPYPAAVQIAKMPLSPSVSIFCGLSKQTKRLIVILADAHSVFIH